MSNEIPIDLNDPDYDDPILAELRQIREEFLAECNYDLSLMLRYFEEQRRSRPIDGRIDDLSRGVKPSSPEAAHRNP